MRGPWWVLSAMALLAIAAVVWVAIEIRSCGASLGGMP